MEILELEQGTAEWQAARRCSITGTKLKQVMGTAEGRRALIAELIAEEATEQSKVFRTSDEMERGNAEEIFAIKAFEKKTGKTVSRPGIVVSSEFDWLKLSPDGLIEENGIFTEGTEVKCPDSKKAILYRIENMIDPEQTGLLSAKGAPLASAPFLGIPSEYKWQIVMYFLVVDTLQKMNFLVYDARFIDEEAKLYVVEVERSNEILQDAMNEAKKELLKFRADWLAWKEIVLPANF